MNKPQTQARCWLSALTVKLGFFKRAICLHEFDLDDLRVTNIAPPEKPAKGDYKAWERYHIEYYESDYVRKRVMWPCAKCGKIFYAHCGLDIYAHGRPKRRLPNAPHEGPGAASSRTVPLDAVVGRHPTEDTK